MGELFYNGRYKVLEKLGWGHFSTVWLVEDSETKSQLALKIVKSAPHYTEAARDEVTLCSQISEGDPEGVKKCVKLLNSFEHRGPHGRHICMVFETMGDNLLTLIRLYNHKGVPLDVVRHLTRQILIGLDYIHTKCHIIHTDLKPENVMLKKSIKPRKTTVHGDGYAIGKIAAALAAGKPLTKNQKKKLKKKQQKAASQDVVQGVESDEEQSAGTLNGDDAVSQISKLSLKELRSHLIDMECKIVDFGNACWTHKHFTDDIQTRQYRSPEVCCFHYCLPTTYYRNG